MPRLPPEILTDILFRLPVKSLLRFRCVSKTWHALIDSPVFIKSHLKKSIDTDTNLSLIINNKGSIYSVDFDTLDGAAVLDGAEELNHPLKHLKQCIFVLGSCNGLLFLSTHGGDFWLWNPSTRKQHCLPESPADECPDYLNSDFILYRFGYDHVNDDYKVVKISQFASPLGFSTNEVKVYSLKTNSWKKIRGFPYYIFFNIPWGEFVSGALHWVGSQTMFDTCDLIVAFDLGVEEYRLVPLPTDEDLSLDYLGVLEDCLCLCSSDDDCFDVWVMKDYGVKESWTKLFSITEPEVIIYSDYVAPLCYSKSGGEVLLVQDDNQLIWYDLKEKRVRDVQIRGMVDSFEAQIYVGSLVPINCDRGIDNKKPQERKKTKNRRNGDDFLSKGFKLVL